MEQNVIYAFSEKQLAEVLRQVSREAALIGAKTACQYMQESQDKADTEKHDRRLHNTRLLLSHYRDFKKHIKGAIYTYQEPDKEKVIQELMSQKDDTVAVESIKKSSKRTSIILQHIDHALEIFRQECQANGEASQRQYSELSDYYIEEGTRLNMTQLSDKYHVAKSTIHNDIRTSEEKLSVLFFGIDGLKFL